jgi:hypothetical protein
VTTRRRAVPGRAAAGDLDRIQAGGVQAIRAYLDQMWARALAGFQQAARQLGEEIPAGQEPATELQEQS